MATISLRPVLLRLFLLLILIAGFGLLGWVMVRAAIGDSIMIYVQRSPNLSTDAVLEGADLAVGYSPHDPVIHLRRGGAYFAAANEDLSEERLARAMEELRRSTQMSPEDYRTWMSLGRALDRAGSTAEARTILEKALQLAPNHFETRWALGNHFLRAGDRDGAFAQMRQALANSPSALPLIFDYAWEVFQGDGLAIAKAIEPPLAVRAQFISMLIVRNKVDDGLAIWRGMNSPTARDAQRVIESLVNIGRYALAYDIWKNANLPERPLSDENSLLSNGGFESTVQVNSVVPFFSWRLKPSASLLITQDRVKPHVGERSLRVSFKFDDNVAVIIVTQTVPAKPNQKYCLTFSAKTEELESLSRPFVEVFDAAELKRAHAATAQFPVGDMPWTDYSIELTTAPATEALMVRLQRMPYAEPPAPISGRVWFDNFRLYECPGLPKVGR